MKREPKLPRILHPARTAAILLGGYDFSASGLGVRHTERMAGHEVRNWLYGQPADQGLGLDSRLDLFGSPLSATDQFAEISVKLGALLKEHPIEDVLVYYVGHGVPGEQGGLSLLVQASLKDTEFVTGIRTADLVEVLRKIAGKQRRYIILDCCFADKAAPDLFTGPVAAAWASRIAESDEEKSLYGTLLFCASSRGIKARAPQGMGTTLFTAAFIEAVSNGSDTKPAVMSFADIRSLCVEFVKAKSDTNPPLPVLHAPDQSMGDLSAALAFDNWAVKPRPAPQTAVPSPANLVQIGLRHEAEMFPALAVRYYRRAAALGAVDGMTRLGALLQEGADGVERDEYEAFKVLNVALEAGDGEAMVRVAFMRGRGVASWNFPPNPRTESKLIQRAAAQGFSDAQCQLGQAYCHRFTLDGIPYDDEKARLWLGKAAEQGHRLGLLQYGTLLLKDAGDEAEANRAKAFLRRAKAGGKPSLWWHLAGLGSSGTMMSDVYFAHQADERIAEFDDREFDEETKQQRMYLRLALRDPDTIHHKFALAQYYEEGWHFLRADREMAFQLYEEVARATGDGPNAFGRSFSQYKTALAYEGGLFGRLASRVEAEHWFRKAKASLFWISDHVFHSGPHEGAKLADLIEEGLRRTTDNA